MELDSPDFDPKKLSSTELWSVLELNFIGEKTFSSFDMLLGKALEFFGPDCEQYGYFDGQQGHCALFQIRVGFYKNFHDEIIEFVNLISQDLFDNSNIYSEDLNIIVERIVEEVIFGEMVSICDRNSSFSCPPIENQRLFDLRFARERR